MNNDLENRLKKLECSTEVFITQLCKLCDERDKLEADFQEIKERPAFTKGDKICVACAVTALLIVVFGGIAKLVMV